MASNNIIGVDIDNDAVNFAYTVGSSYKVDRAELPDGIFKDGRITAPIELGKFIKKQRKLLKIKGKNVNLVLPASDAYFRKIEIPYMSESELKLNLPYEFSDFLTLDSNSYFYDYNLAEIHLDPETQKPISLSIYAAATPKESIAFHKRIIETAGFKLHRALPREMVYNATFKEYYASDQVHLDEIGLVHIGSAVTNIIIYKQGQHVTTKNIERGYDGIDSIVADVKSVDIHTASLYRENNFEDTWDLPEVVNYCNSLATEAVKTLNFYNFSNRDNTLNSLFFGGAGANVSVIPDSISKMTGYDAHYASDLLPADGLKPEEVAPCSSAFACLLNG